MIRSDMNLKMKWFYFLVCLFCCWIADWKTLLTFMRFSIYPPRIWFSDLSFRFSSLTSVTFLDKSSNVLCNSSTRSIKRCFSSSSSELLPPFVVLLRCELFEIESPYLVNFSIKIKKKKQHRIIKLVWLYIYHHYPIHLVDRDLRYRSFLSTNKKLKFK